MLRKLTLALTALFLLAGASANLAYAASPPMLNLPPGIAAQAEPLLAAMMARMEQAGMTPEQMQQMMADMQAMVDALPPGIFLQILELMPQLDMQDMMTVHQQIHQGQLLEAPPGQILRFVKALAS